jgi:hypothetical protein
MSVEFRLDWLRFTVHGMEDYKPFWSEIFEERLGGLVYTGSGSAGFKEMWKASEGAFLHNNPGSYWNVELKGSACKCLLPEDFRGVVDICRSYGKKVRLVINRLDLAWDGVSFTPGDFYKRVYNTRVLGKPGFVSRAKKFSWNESPVQECDNGDIGTSTAYLGSMERGHRAERLLRVYDSHGFVRVELECRGEWAQNYYTHLMATEYKAWKDVGLGFLRSYCNFEDWEAWDCFMRDVIMTEIKVYSARAVSATRLENWIGRQVAPALVALTSILGGEAELWSFLGRNVDMDRLEKYKSVMQLGE